jgi:hypothetical protein
MLLAVTAAAGPANTIGVPTANAGRGDKVKTIAGEGSA